MKALSNHFLIYTDSSHCAALAFLCSRLPLAGMRFFSGPASIFTLPEMVHDPQTLLFWHQQTRVPCTRETPNSHYIRGHHEGHHKTKER